jgi:hypothetical protein
MTSGIEEAGYGTICSGCQSTSATLRIACAANLGNATSSSVSALDAFNATTCESTVGSVTS